MVKIPDDSREITQSLAEKWRPKFCELKSRFVYSRHKNIIARQDSFIQPPPLPWLWDRAFSGELSSEQDISRYILEHRDYKGVMDHDGQPISKQARKNMFYATDERIVECRSQNFFAGFMREINAAALMVKLNKGKGKVFRSNVMDLEWDVDIILGYKGDWFGFAVRHSGSASYEHERNRKNLKSCPGVITLRAAQSDSDKLDVCTEEEIKQGVEKALVYKTDSH